MVDEVIIKKEIIDYVKVNTGNYEEIKRYVTKDGEEFTSEKDALKHEDYLKIKTIKKHDFEVMDGYWWWYLATTEEELTFLKRFLPDSFCDPHGIDTLKVGEWFAMYRADGGDYRGYEYYITLSDWKKNYDELYAELDRKAKV